MGGVGGGEKNEESGGVSDNQIELAGIGGEKCHEVFQEKEQKKKSMLGKKTRQ